MLSAVERVNLVETESRRLESYLESLAANAWDQPSKCELWTVADVLAHLTWASDYFIATISRGIKGDVSPPSGWPETGTSGPEFFNAFIGEKAIEARKALGDGLVREFQARNHRLQELISSVGPDELDMPCYGPFAPRTVQLFITTRVQELAVHGWDIQASLEPSSHLSPATVPIVLERMPQWLDGKGLSSFRAPSTENAAAGPSTVRYRLATRAGTNHDIVATGDSCVVESAGESPGSDASVLLRCDGEAAGLMVYERVSVDSVYQSGSIEGDQTLGNDFLSWLKQS